MSSFHMSVYRGRTRDFTVRLFESDGTTAIVLQNDDVVRVKISRGNDLVLDLSSVAGESDDNGSIVLLTTPASGIVTVRIAQDDTVDLETGAYDCEVSVVDNSEPDAPATGPANAIKHAQYGVMFLHPAPGGVITDEESSGSSSSSSNSSSASS